MPTFTLTLDDDAAERTEYLLKTFGGTVPGFARQLVSDVSMLPASEIVKLRQEIHQRLETLKSQGKPPQN